MTQPGASMSALPRGATRLAAAVTLAASVGIGSAAADPEIGTFTLVVENDLFQNADQHYTSGVRVTWTSGPDALPDWVVDAAHAFPPFPAAGNVRSEFGVGQDMFTSSDIRDPDPPAGERPYAGWLYGQVGLVAENDGRLDRIQLQLGVVGPLSFAEEAQKLVHELTGADRPLGWDTQLRNEPGFVLSYQRSWRAWSSEVGGFGLDATPHLGGAAGNVLTYASTGLTLRAGFALPSDYGPPRIRPGLPGSGFFEPQGRFGWYLFAGLEGRAVARNIFLDGNSWRDSRRVDRKPLVGDVQFGLAVTFPSARIAYTHVFRSREFESQDRPDAFGAVSLSFRF